MKKFIYIPFLFIIALFSSCFKDYEERYLFVDNRVEFDAAVIHPNASGRTYPLLTPVEFDAGIVRYRVNLTGEQPASDLTLQFRVVPEESTAREEIDYRLPKGNSFVIPANSSFGWVEIEVLPGGTGSPRLVLELIPTDAIKVMDRYHTIGQQILFPSTPPNPDDTHEINDIRYFTNITFGSSANPAVGNFIDLQSGYAYIWNGATANQPLIDFIILRSGAGTEQNILAPSSGSVTAWGTTSQIPNEWDVRNDGQLMRLPNPSSQELELFEQAQSRADLEAAYDYYLATLADRPNYSSTNDGPSTRIRAVGTGDLIAFRSASRDVIAIMKVEESLPGTTGHLRGDLKSGGNGQNWVQPGQ